MVFLQWIDDLNIRFYFSSLLLILYCIVICVQLLFPFNDFINKCQNWIKFMKQIISTLLCLILFWFKLGFHSFVLFFETTLNTFQEKSWEIYRNVWIKLNTIWNFIFQMRFITEKLFYHLFCLKIFTEKKHKSIWN